MNDPRHPLHVAEHNQNQNVNGRAMDTQRGIATGEKRDEIFLPVLPREPPPGLQQGATHHT